MCQICRLFIVFFMVRRLPCSQRTATRRPFTTLFRSAVALLVLYGDGGRQNGPNAWIIGWTNSMVAEQIGGSSTQTFSSSSVRQQSNSDIWFVSGQRSEEHTSELQSLMRILYAVFCWQKKHIVLYIYVIYHNDLR